VDGFGDVDAVDTPRTHSLHLASGFGKWTVGRVCGPNIYLVIKLMRNLNKPGQFEWVRRSLSFGTFKFWFGCFDYTLNSLPLSKKKR